jgi:hypothetical protein
VVNNLKKFLTKIVYRGKFYPMNTQALERLTMRKLLKNMPHRLTTLIGGFFAFQASGGALILEAV